MARGRELFPSDRGLQARMVVASVLTPALVLAAAFAVVVLAPTRVLVFFGLAVVIGVGMAIKAYQESEHPRPLTPAEAPELHGAVERLCAVADLPKPEVLRVDERQPNSWVVARPLRRPQLHVTSGLLDLLTAAELEAVIAHELAHLAHHDARVMTVVGGPGAALLDGGAVLVRTGWWGIPGGLVAMAVGVTSRVGTVALSRYRELAADAGAAAMTGQPATLAAALSKVSGGIARIPAADLRTVSGRDAFHLVPTGDESDRRWFHRVGGDTHPHIEDRIARLERMEQRLHAARTPGSALSR